MRWDAEVAHTWTLNRLAALSRHPRALAVLRRMWSVEAPVQLFGLRFANAVGLAAGMDKDGVALPVWPALGFGFVEVGTVTRREQPGNSRPRLFRLSGSKAIINRMGFNNQGAEALAQCLRAHRDRHGRLSVPVGISLGKSRDTPLVDAVQDYLACLRLLRDHGDYFAINVSSPNTPGLRKLQDRAELDQLLAVLVDAAAGKPLLVKLAPDLTDAAIAQALKVCLDRAVAGVIAVNTTLARAGVAARDVTRARQAGGLSGRPLAVRARRVVSFVRREAGGALPIIGVGGILDPVDALRLIDAGADLVQLYTGLVYRGPGLVKASALGIARANQPNQPHQPNQPNRAVRAEGGSHG